MGLAEHGANKIPRYPYWLEYQEDPLANVVRASIEQKLFLSEWLFRSHRLQMALRRRRDRRWNEASAFVILYDGWLVLQAPDRFQALKEISGFDPEFGKDMLPVLCLRQDPSLDTMD